MYYLTNDRDIVKNIITIGKACGVNDIKKEFDLCRCYRSYLKKLDPSMEIIPNGINIILDPEKTHKMINKYEGQDTEGYFKTNAVPFELKQITNQKNIIYQSIEKLEEYWRGSWLIRFLFHSIFFAYSKKMAGGSTSNAIGVLWANVPESFSLDDVNEFIVHEIAHQITFIDEIVYGDHYDYKKIKINDLYTKSAILNLFRPADKVFHSVIVAHTIISYRKEIMGNNFGINIHGESAVLLNNAISSSEMLLDIDDKHKILSNRGRCLIDKCHNSLINHANKTVLEII